MSTLGNRKLCLLFTPASCHGDPWQTLLDALAAGVDLVQWRVKQADRLGLEQCMSLCEAKDVPVIVNDQVGLAVDVAAAGVHVGQDDLPAAAARQSLNRDELLGVSTHDVEQARAAAGAGADYIGLGPCFPTTTKGYESALPRDVIGAVIAAVDLPIFAIGGITPDNLSELIELGLHRCAVSSVVLDSDRPGAVVEQLRRVLS